MNRWKLQINFRIMTGIKEGARKELIQYSIGILNLHYVTTNHALEYIRKVEKTNLEEY